MGGGRWEEGGGRRCSDTGRRGRGGRGGEEGEGEGERRAARLGAIPRLRRLVLALGRLGARGLDDGAAQQTHDLLKVEELRQSFRLKFDVVLVMSLKDGGMQLQMGPPKHSRVSHAALSEKEKDAALGSMERVHNALLVIQRQADKYTSRLRANRATQEGSTATSG